jgi:phosphoribosylamine-glycine ligase
MYYGAVESGPDRRLRLTGSRALAFVGLGESLAEAQLNAESGASSVKGPVFHRRDIGAAALIKRRIDHMDALLGRRSTGAMRFG